MKKKDGRISAAERALIKSCAENGVEIESLGNGSTFRFIPAAAKQPNAHAAPSSRGTYAPSCTRKGCPCKKAQTWRPSRLPLDPQYTIAMAGDPPALTRARQAWADGNASDLIAYLAAQQKPPKVDCNDK